jgi:hypothetical protein
MPALHPDRTAAHAGRIFRVRRLVAVMLCMIGGFDFATARAGEASSRLGALTIVYEADRWRAARATEDDVQFYPVGTDDHHRGRVLVSRHLAGDDKACETVANGLLAPPLYEWPTAEGTLAFAGLTASRFRAHTRCRNATPEGVVICVAHRGYFYTVLSRQIGCRDGSDPFAGPGWLDEFVKGAKLSP